MTHQPDRTGLRILVIDVGTTGLRAAIVDERLAILHYEYRSTPPDIPFDGLVEFDATALAATVLEACRAALDWVASNSGEQPDQLVDAIGITNQRASTVVWDRATGEPIGPGLGWQDLRTINECIMVKVEAGWTVAPNQSLTKVAWLLENTPGATERDLCFGTIDSWITWTLTEGADHVSDATNMSTTTTGMRIADGTTWSSERLERFGIPQRMLPRVVDSAGFVARATALPGAPPITALIGDQQASLVGQGCVRPGIAKITLGTGGMVDVVTDAAAPTEIRRDAAGTYRLPVWQLDGELTWGAEGIMLSAGTNIEWLRDDLGIIESSSDSHNVAQQVTDTGGVLYVPALLGLGTPAWDYGARGILLGLTRGSQRSHITRAVLDGIAHRCADLVDAIVTDAGIDVEVIRLDGGMSKNPTLVQLLADATGRAVEVSPTTEATTRGAAFLAGLGHGFWDDIERAAELWEPAAVAIPQNPADRDRRRARWGDAIARSAEWYPDLSALDF